MGSSYGAVFDEDAHSQPTTPDTPIDKEPETSRSEADPFTTWSSNHPIQQEPFAEKIRPSKTRGSAKSKIQEADSPLAKNRRQTRSRSSASKVQISESNPLTNNHLSPTLSGNPAPRRATSRPVTPAQRSALNVIEIPDPNDHHAHIPGAFESQSIQAELHTENSIEQAPQIERASAEPLESPDLSGPRILEEDVQRMKFEKFGSEKNPLRSRAINGKIYKCLKDSHSPKHKTGWVYMFKSPERAPKHVKIGISHDEPSERKKKWEQCHGQLIVAEDPDGNAFDHFSIVESLIKAELYEHRRRVDCAVCPRQKTGQQKKHEEWYEIDTTRAVKHITRWRSWIKSQTPFDDDGNLTPYWRWRVDELPKILDTVDWDKWTNPSLFEYWMYQVNTSNDKSLQSLRPLVSHLSRKDAWFSVVGIVILQALYINLGLFGVVWGILGLIAL